MLSAALGSGPHDRAGKGSGRHTASSRRPRHWRALQPERWTAAPSPGLLILRDPPPSPRGCCETLSEVVVWGGVVAPPAFYFLFPLPSILQGDCNAGNPSSCRQEPCAPRLYPVSCTNDSPVPAVQIFRSLARSPVGESASVLERAGWAPTGSRALPLPRVCWRPHPRPSQLARSFLVAPAGAARLSHTAGHVTARGFPDAPWASLGFPWL